MNRLLITDVDNTLLDWQSLWFVTFSAMARRALDISGVDPCRFYAECSAIHQRYGTSEYAFVLAELPCLRELYGNDVIKVMQPAIDDYRVARRRNLALYPDVLRTLQNLKRVGVTTAAFTESKAFYTNYRFRRLGLDGMIDYLYSPPDHTVPYDLAMLRKYDPSDYDLKWTVHRFTPEGELKPNPHILLSIVTELGFAKENAVYLGDNKLKDVYMAQQAGVLDVYAAYGAAQHRTEQYELLKKVTHWTPEMVARERDALKPDAIKPTYTLTRSFAEIEPIVMDRL